MGAINDRLGDSLFKKRSDMHELSIARSIVELVEEQADNRGSLGGEELELEIGHLSGERSKP